MSAEKYELESIKNRRSNKNNRLHFQLFDFTTSAKLKFQTFFVTFFVWGKV